MRMKRKKRTIRGISKQLSYLIIAGVIVAGMFTLVVQYAVTEQSVRVELGKRAAETAREVISALREYPSCEWLLSYWYEHKDRMDVEYDVDFSGESATEAKERLFSARNPDRSIRYLSREEVEALPDEDQKLFAEIAYSWILSRVNESKRNLGCDYLYLAETGTDDSEHPYETQCFLMSGAGPGAVRGTAYGEVYTLGVTTEVADKNASESMRKAVKMVQEDQPDQPDSDRVAGEKFTGSGNYVDYYACVDVAGDRAYLAGATYKVNSLISLIFVEALKSTLIAFLCEILLLWIVMQRVGMYIIVPLKKILASIRSYSQTRDSAAAEKDMSEILSGKTALAIRENEIGQLAEDFTDLTKEIDNYVEEIRAATSQKEKYQTELSIAARIQEQVLPKDLPDVLRKHAFDLRASMTPAREVGGDFYDFFFTDQDHLALIIGDVSDKGVPAALFMMTTKTLIKNLTKMEKSPARIISLVNDQLCENNDSGYFVTVWFALINLATGEGVTVNAGHEYPAVCKAGGTYELIQSKHSLSVGAMPGIRYRENAFQMDPGDQLFVYTDGVPEAINKDEEQFGTDRMLEVLNRNIDAGPEKILACMKEELAAFAGEVPQFDDTTMLCFRYKGVEN